MIIRLYCTKRGFYSLMCQIEGHALHYCYDCKCFHNIRSIRNGTVVVQYLKPEYKAMAEYRLEQLGGLGV